MTSPMPPQPVPGEPYLTAPLAAQTVQQGADAYTALVVAPWLAAIQQAIAPAGGIFDPFGVLAAGAQWTAGVGRFLADQVLPWLRAPFRSLFGPEVVFFDQAPFVNSYLPTVTNLLVRTPFEVFVRIRAQVQLAADAGTPIPDLAEEINRTLLDENAPWWRNRALVIARTELRRAQMGGLWNAYATYGRDRGVRYTKRWLDSNDARVREAHVDTDGQVRAIDRPFAVGVDGGPKFPAMYPLDPILPPELSIQCFPGDTLMRASAIHRVFRRWYEGPIVRVEFKSGAKLAGTPNHPVLTASGWKALQLLEVGDQCVRTDHVERLSGSDPHVEDAPTPAEKIYTAALQSSASYRVAASGVYFHGDGADTEVNVVTVHSQLRDEAKTCGTERGCDKIFAGPHVTVPALRGLRSDLGAVDKVGMASPGIARAVPSASPVGDGRQGTALVEVQALHSDGVRLGSAAWSDARFEQVSAHGSAVYPEALRDAQLGLSALVCGDEGGGVQVGARVCTCVASASHRDSGCSQVVSDLLAVDADALSDLVRALPGQVPTDDVIHIETSTFVGHVYNLETSSGWYSANGIAAHNCRCDMLIEEPGEETDLSDRRYVSAGGAR